MSNNQVVYKIRADGKGYVRTLQQMRGDTKKFGNDVKSEMSGISGAIKGAFAYVGFTSFKNVIDEVAQLGRLARNLGADFEGFQTVTNAARQFGIEAETVADAIKDLDVKMTDGSLGAKAYAEVFDLVGISLDEAMGMNSLERFYAFADAVKAADGQLSAFSADEINDAMFRLVPLLEKGSAGIKNLGNEYAKFSKEQQKMAEAGSKAWDNMVHNLKWFVATLAGIVIPAMQNFAHTIGAVLGEGVAQFSLFGKGLQKFFTGDFAGANAAFGALADYASGSFERVSQEIKDIWKDTTDEIEKGAGTGKGGVSKATQEKIDDAKSRVEEEVNKQLAEQEKRRQALMNDEEKLLDIQRKRLELVEKIEKFGTSLFEKGGATPEESVRLAEMETELEEIRTKEQEKQLEIQKQKEDAAKSQAKQAEIDEKKRIKQQEKDEADFAKESEKEAGIRDEIEQEKRDRAEIGMSDEDILAKRKREVAQMQKDLTKGTFAGPSEVAEAELEIERRLTDIKSLEQSIADQQEDPQTSIIASSLAAIGGGGGVASFGTDPILSENKKQSRLLEEIVKLQGGTPEGGTNLITPEL